MIKQRQRLDLSLCFFNFESEVLTTLFYCLSVLYNLSHYFLVQYLKSINENGVSLLAVDLCCAIKKSMILPSFEIS